MITVKDAENIIQENAGDYGNELIPFSQATGRVLAETLFSDRDMPPYNRATMDGVAIQFNDFANGISHFTIKGTQAAGDNPIEISQPGDCIEIMTGAALPASADTVVPYENLAIANGIATITNNKTAKGKNIHYRGRDRKQNDVVATAGQWIDAAMINVATTIGKTELSVKKLPRVLIISTGDELVDVAELPGTYQIRRSNNHTLKAILEQCEVQPDIAHLPDDPIVMERALGNFLRQYDVLILSGGISMGKFDHLPLLLEKLSVQKLFHKVKQRPGKPFWFGIFNNGPLVFAFPGNPVASFMCTCRYFMPWLEASLGVPAKPPVYAVLNSDVTFEPELQYFMQVNAVMNENAQLAAYPVQGNGSGDLANLMDTNAFMELPMERSNFMKGEIFRVWPFKKIV